MADRIAVDESIEGRRVVNAESEDVGVVSGVRGDTLYVDPSPGIADTLISTLSREDVDGNDFSIDPASIERITDDEVRLKPHG